MVDSSHDVKGDHRLVGLAEAGRDREGEMLVVYIVQSRPIDNTIDQSPTQKNSNICCTTAQKGLDSPCRHVRELVTMQLPNAPQKLSRSNGLQGSDRRRIGMHSKATAGGLVIQLGKRLLWLVSVAETVADLSLDAQMPLLEKIDRPTTSHRRPRQSTTPSRTSPNPTESNLGNSSIPSKW